MMRKIFATCVLSMFLFAFVADEPLKGNWIYSGGIYNGKATPPSKDYTLQRQYDAAHY
jgi:hypothetical protein